MNNLGEVFYFFFRHPCLSAPVKSTPVKTPVENEAGVSYPGEIFVEPGVTGVTPVDPGGKNCTPVRFDM